MGWSLTSETGEDFWLLFKVVGVGRKGSIRSVWGAKGGRRDGEVV